MFTVDNCLLSDWQELELPWKLLVDIDLAGQALQPWKDPEVVDWCESRHLGYFYQRGPNKSVS